MSVRRSTLGDIDSILELLTEFADKTPIKKLSVGLRGYVERALGNENMVVLVSDTGTVNGVLIGSITVNPIYDTIWLQELAWYARDNSGVRMLFEFERIAHAVGADVVYMATLPSTDSRVHELLTRRGYLQIERGYVLQL